MQQEDYNDNITLNFDNRRFYFHDIDDSGSFTITDSVLILNSDKYEPEYLYTDDGGLTFRSKNNTFEIYNQDNIIELYNNSIDKQRTKVSVLIPVYNNEYDILNAIKSIVNQTYKNWEMIVIDDCSTDNTNAIVSWFIRNNLQYDIKLIRNIRNSGCYVSMNEGLLIAQGEYITRLDSDDTFDSKKLETQVKILDENLDKVMTSCQHNRGDSVEVTLMYRKKEVLEQAGYYDNSRAGADTEFLERLLKIFGEDKNYHIHTVLYYVQERPNSLTNSQVTGYDSEYRCNYIDNYKARHETNNLYVKYPFE